MASSLPRHLKPFAKAAREAGWTIEWTRNSHLKFIPPPGQGTPVITGSTPSDGRALKNFRADLRRRGLEV